MIWISTTKLTTSRTVNTINATGSLSGIYSSYPEPSQEDVSMTEVSLSERALVFSGAVSKVHIEASW